MTPTDPVEKITKLIADYLAENNATLLTAEPYGLNAKLSTTLINQIQLNVLNDNRGVRAASLILPLENPALTMQLIDHAANPDRYTHNDEPRPEDRKRLRALLTNQEHN